MDNICKVAVDKGTAIEQQWLQGEGSKEGFGNRISVFLLDIFFL